MSCQEWPDALMPLKNLKTLRVITRDGQRITFTNLKKGAALPIHALPEKPSKAVALYYYASGNIQTEKR